MSIDPFDFADKKGITGDIIINDNSGQYTRRDYDTQKAIKHAYQICSWVNFGITQHARAIRRIPWKVFVKEGKNWNHKDRHKLQKFVDGKVNPNYSLQTLLALSVMYMYLGGNATSKIVNVKDAKKEEGKPELALIDIPSELWLLFPWNVKFKKSDDEQSIIGFKHEVKKRNPEEYIPDEILHFHFENPDDPLIGTGRLQSIAQIIDMDVNAVTWQLTSMIRRGVPGLVISFENKIDQIQWKRAMNWVKQTIVGPEKAYNALVLGQKANVSHIARTPVDLDWREGRNMVRDEILTLLGYHPAMVSTEASTYNNMNVAKRYVWEEERIPLLDLIREELNRKITPKFGDPSELYLDYDLSHVKELKDTLEQRSITYARLVENGVKLNVAAQRVELDVEPLPDELGNQVFIKKSLVPLKANPVPDPEVKDTL